MASYIPFHAESDILSHCFDENEDVLYSDIEPDERECDLIKTPSELALFLAEKKELKNDFPLKEPSELLQKNSGVDKRHSKRKKNSCVGRKTIPKNRQAFTNKSIMHLQLLVAARKHVPVIYQKTQPNGKQWMISWNHFFGIHGNLQQAMELCASRILAAYYRGHDRRCSLN